jgi:hypothetical protein
MILEATEASETVSSVVGKASGSPSLAAADADPRGLLLGSYRVARELD